MRASALSGLRVLLVEDELLVAMLVEDLLADEGCIVVGPFSRLRDALAAARTEALDLAVLDVNVAGEKAYPVAEVLTERRIPFLFVSGYGEGAIPADRPRWRACPKPFRSGELVAMLREQLGRG